MQRTVFPSKLIEEIITVEFFFMEDLPIGETLTGVTVTAVVAQGVDPSPSSIVLSTPRVTGGRVRQWIVAGLPGVTYYLTCQATFSGSGDVHTREGYLSVVPGIGESNPFPPGYPLPLVIEGDAPDGALGAFYEYSYDVSGGIIPYTSSIIAGALPTSLDMLPVSFTVDGIPTVAGLFTFTVQAQDSYGQLASLEDSIYIHGWWFAGPVAINGAAGGSQQYYKRTYNPLDWSSDPIPFPFSRGSLQWITSANQTLFFIYSSGTATVSFDYGQTWSECDNALTPHKVYWNGSYYVARHVMSADGITWTAIPNLPGTPSETIARDSDGLIAIVYVLAGNTTFAYTLDNGTTWTSVTAIFPGEGAGDMFTNGSRINFSIGSPSTTAVLGYYTDDLFATQQASGSSYSGLYQAKYGCYTFMQKEFSNRIVRSWDGGFSFKTSLSSADVTQNDNAFAFGEVTWAASIFTSAGSPQVFEIAVSQDNGDSWTRNAGTIYGDGVSVEFIGPVGECALFPQPTYTLITARDILTGDPSAMVNSSQRTWPGMNAFVASPSGAYIAHGFSSSTQGIRVYKRNTVQGGYDLLPTLTPTVNFVVREIAWSADEQYLMAIGGSGLLVVVWQRVGDTFTSLTLPATLPTSPGACAFNNASTKFIIFESSTAATTCYLYDISGTSITGPITGPRWNSNQGTSGWCEFSPDDKSVAVSNNLGFAVYNADIGGTVPILDSNYTFPNGISSRGIFWHSDNAHIIVVGGNAGTSVGVYAWDNTSKQIGAPTWYTDPQGATGPKYSAISKNKGWLGVCCTNATVTEYVALYKVEVDGSLTKWANPPTTTNSIILTWINT